MASNMGSNGTPPNDILANIMHSTRKQYHTAIKHFLKYQINERNNQLALSRQNHSPCVFWKEVKLAYAHKSKISVSNSIGGHNSPADKADGFQKMYQNIFRAGFTSAEDITFMRADLDNARTHSD